MKSGNFIACPNSLSPAADALLDARVGIVRFHWYSCQEAHQLRNENSFLLDGMDNVETPQGVLKISVCRDSLRGLEMLEEVSLPSPERAERSGKIPRWFTNFKIVADRNMAHVTLELEGQRWAMSFGLRPHSNPDKQIAVRLATKRVSDPDIVVLLDQSFLRRYWEWGLGCVIAERLVRGPRVDWIPRPLPLLIFAASYVFGVVVLSLPGGGAVQTTAWPLLFAVAVELMARQRAAEGPLHRAIAWVGHS